MSELELQLKKALGTVGFCLLLKSMRTISIAFDAEDRTVTIYRDKHEPVVIQFAVIEDFVNNVH